MRGSPSDGSAAVKRGNPPAIGVGLMRKLAKRLVAVTPEHYTSKTRCKCLGPCGPRAVGRENGQEGAPQNRDQAACNIGLQFRRLFAGEGALRALSDEEREFQRLQAACAACG